MCLRMLKNIDSGETKSYRVNTHMTWDKHMGVVELTIAAKDRGIYPICTNHWSDVIYFKVDRLTYEMLTWLKTLNLPIIIAYESRDFGAPLR